MNDNSFIDTNILVNCFTEDEPEKRVKALKVTDTTNTYISTQVLTEIANTLHKKFGYSWSEIEPTLNEINTDFNVYVNKPYNIERACKIAEKYHYSFYDSLIISAALSCNCKILYSEDMQNGQIIENSLTIINPFN